MGFRQRAEVRVTGHFMVALLVVLPGSVVLYGVLCGSTGSNSAYSGVFGFIGSHFK